jgi:hypothetical protein
MVFGVMSEWVARKIEQLELKLGGLATVRAERVLDSVRSTVL